MDYKYENIPLLDFIKTLTIYRGLTIKEIAKKNCTRKKATAILMQGFIIS